MTCQEFWTSENEVSSSHLAECPACAEAWKREQALVAGFRAIRAEHNAVEAPARVEARLMSAFHGYAGLGVPRVGTMQPAWIPAVTWVSAAAALAMLALLLVRDREPKPVQRSAPNAVHFAESGPVPGTSAAPDTEIAEGEFIPLPNAAELDAGEEMNLVRLEFPRSAMLALGFDVSEDRAEEPVSADVMIGPDGMARAVRFLED